MAEEKGMDADNDVYDVCVVGAGMIGSAAAKYLSEAHEHGRKRILLIGPGEPKDPSSQDIFGAWHDEGRLVCILHPIPVWCHFSLESAKGYHELEQRSGCQFYHEVGWLNVGPKGCEWNELVKKNGDKNAMPYETFDRLELQNRFPYFSLPDSFEGIYTHDKCGHISPRNLVHIQQKLAKENGCKVIEDIVSKIEKDSAVKVITTDKGHIYKAGQVLVTTGAFTMCRDVLPKGLHPKVDLTSATVILVRISQNEAKRLQDMPSFGIIRSDPLHQESDYDIYGLPPILYPDGNYYMKIGHTRTDRAKTFTAAKDLQDWFHGSGDPDFIQELKEIFKMHFPDIIIEDVISDKCVITRTPNGLPYIDMIDIGFGVAIGGNGSGARCSDEIGKEAAMMIANGNFTCKAFKAEMFNFQSE